MNVFLSWSKPTSHSIALALYEWVPQVINAVRPWLSSEDISKGRRWSHEIATNLEGVKIGIFCLTPDNIDAPWLMFEAGAISKMVAEGHVCPYLLNLRPSEIVGPLAQFQSTLTTKTDTLRLLETINKALESPLTENQLQRSFEKWWPELEEKIKDISSQSAPQVTEAKRSSEDLLEEILDISRQLAASSAHTEGRLATMFDYMMRYVEIVSNNVASALGEPPQTDWSGLLSEAPELGQVSGILAPRPGYRARRNNLPQSPRKEK